MTSSSSSWLSDWTKTVVSSVSEATSVLESGVNRASDALEKLTLTTPEMTIARHQLAVAAQDREHRRMQLAALYPWETNDPDRSILVAECQTAILQMSQNKSTFFGPFVLPPPPAVKSKASNHDEEPAVPSVERKTPDDELPSAASLAMLAQLQPLPRFLGENDFDLQMHVGLIEKLLKVDKNLVQMQANYQGGGGIRETKFWHNYFLHVAHGRYTAGLGLDEIWGDHVVLENSAAATAAPNTPDTTTLMGAAASMVGAAVTAAAAAAAVNSTAATAKQQGEMVDESEGEVVEFDDNPAAAAAPPGSGTTANTSLNNSNGFELVSSEGSADHDHDDAAAAKNANDDTDDIDIGSDYELDELEAEIARELED
jgi:hypothetical protein